MVPTLSHFISCNVTSFGDSKECKNELDLLLSRALSLSLLGFAEWRLQSSAESLPLEIKNTWLKGLNLTAYKKPYDEEQCIRCSRSRLAMQCEELHICVKNRISICCFVKVIREM
ncbi:unnamed protein product [Rotaria sp. Silwood1]|nr:unnamed protein product [Rotaria sp. Silwood1]CAF1651829.1 unnamed protein product [Rotaria sp. Silwood1]CAF3834481.1 unnamed protein product [Rotaria sp. Silwood1]CAF4733705.1 unnamed protein product [Rotaria sp. Silwood1]CAF4837603.1 unnamed protein product [Rotaria sp. Silwood1]